MEKELAGRYINYVEENSKLWSMMFEHITGDVPDWYHEKNLRLLGKVQECLSPWFRKGQHNLRLHHAQILWMAMHGISSVQTAGKLVLKESASYMAESLINTYLLGLERNSIN